MAQEHSWRVSIIDYGVKAADQFMAHPQNWRKHPQRQRDALKGSLDRVGWIAPVIENKRTGHVLDGHERVWSALQNDNAEVPFILVDVPEEDEPFVLTTFDPIAALAEADAGKLDELLAEVQTGDAALQEMLSDLAKDAALTVAFGDVSTDREKQGVSSTWDQVKTADHDRVVFGDLEIKLPQATIESVKDLLEREYAERAIPYFVTMETVLSEGVRAFAPSDS